VGAIEDEDAPALAEVIGHIAMATDHCAGMGHMCEAPCGATAGVAVVPDDALTPDLLTSLQPQLAPLLPVTFVLSSVPPPKS
jgi:hypothetical protein